MRAAKAAVSIMVSSLVYSPRITSTKGILRTGLKKCMPTTRSGLGRPSAILLTESEDVFVAMMHLSST